MTDSPTAVLTGDDTPWDNCPVSIPNPAGISIETFGLTVIGSALPVGELFDKKIGKEIVIGHQVFPLKSIGYGSPTGHVIVHWTITFTRVHGT